MAVCAAMTAWEDGFHTHQRHACVMAKPCCAWTAGTHDMLQRRCANETEDSRRLAWVPACAGMTEWGGWRTGSRTRRFGWPARAELRTVY
jgi:hypothetical protein